MPQQRAIRIAGQFDAYEPTFLEALEPALPHIARHRIKVAVNAGASDTKKLYEVVTKMVKGKGLDLKVAWISGDEVLLDIPAKARMVEQQIRAQMKSHIDTFTRLEFQIIGSCAADPKNQKAATVDFRVIAQARKAEDLATAKFVRPCIDPIMCAYPGATPHLDLRQAFPKEVFEYYVTLLPQASIEHKVHLSSGETIDIPPPTQTQTYPKHQPTQDTTTNPTTLSTFGSTVRLPLGTIVHARSGDKGSDCNVGFWVRYQDEYAWLQNLLTAEFMKHLLADEYKGGSIERCEFPGLRAVHFLLKDHLDRGVSCTTSVDFLGKNCAEYLRARWVDVPLRFVARGKI